MRSLRLALSLLLALTCHVAAARVSTDAARPESYRQPQVRELVQLVNEAAAQVRQQGEQAFAEFRKPGKWFRGKEGFYLFIFDLDGNQVLNAAFPEVEKNRLDWRDSWGKPLFRLAIEKLSPAGENRDFWWVHYLWPKPGETKPSWKSTYMVRTHAPAGQTYVVAAGLYDVATEPVWVELLVQDAVDLIKAKGKAAFPVISSRTSEFMYRDTYVFVLDQQGNELANGAFPELSGKNLLALPTFPRKQLIRDEIAFVKSQGQGWMTGAWPRPGETHAVPEELYLQGITVDRTLQIVGSAIYAPRD